MQHLDADYIQDVMRRLRAMPNDTVPKWGTLRKDGLIEHLIWTVQHSMGRSKQMHFMGNWFTERVLAPMLMRGWIRIPKNLKLPKKVEERGVTLREPGDINTLQALLEEYIHLVQADELQPAFHPVLGNIGVDGWDRMHVKHFEHHLRQFGV